MNESLNEKEIQKKVRKEALKRNPSLVITSKINKKLILSKQIKVDHSLQFLTKCVTHLILLYLQWCGGH